MAAFYLHLVIGQQAIADLSVKHSDTRVDFRQGNSLARTGFQRQQVGEDDLARQPGHRTKGGCEVEAIGQKTPGAFNTVIGPIPVNPPGPGYFPLHIGDHTQRERGQLFRLEPFVEGQ